MTPEQYEIVEVRTSRACCANCRCGIDWSVEPSGTLSPTHGRARTRSLSGIGHEQDTRVKLYDVELAEICLKQARAAKSRAVAAELRRMAKEYQKRAAEPDQAAVQQAPQIRQAAYRHPPPAGREKRAAK